MKKLLFKLLFIAPVMFSFNMFGALSGKTITLTDKTTKPLVIKVGSRSFTLNPNETKIFDFEMIRGAETGYQGSILPYRPLDLAVIALNLSRSNSNNVNVDLIPGSVWQAKIANISYGSAPKTAQKTGRPTF